MTESYLSQLNELVEKGRLRELRPLAGRRGCTVLWQGERLVNLTSNDYLGLASNEEVQRGFLAASDHGDHLERFGLGVASSRLLAGDSQSLHLLEEELALAYRRPAALFFNSGYHANIGILPALFDRHDLILSDKLNHASIHDGMRLANATHKRYRHCDYDHLESLLQKYRGQHRQAVIVSESVFSMDGDEADLARLVELKKRYDAMLYLDEAHAVGLYGPRGLGKAEESGLIMEIDLLVGTFGKALASVGAYVLCSAEFRSYLVNHSRSLIFTTALPPITISWNRHVFAMMQKMTVERERLRRVADRLRKEIRERGLSTMGSTNIVPVVIGDDGRTSAAALAMQDHGYLVLPVRPPTVPEGTARFRLSLTADMRWDDLAGLGESLSGVLRHYGEGGGDGV